MKKIIKTKLALTTTTIRQLDADALRGVAGGNARAPINSNRDAGCNGAGFTELTNDCDTGN